MMEWLTEMGLDRKMLGLLQTNAAAHEAYKVRHIRVQPLGGSRKCQGHPTQSLSMRRWPSLSCSEAAHQVLSSCGSCIFR